MWMGLEEGLKLGRERLQLGYFQALGARVVSSEIWFVADLLKLTVRWQARQLTSRQMSACLGYSGRGRGAKGVREGSGVGSCGETKSLRRLSSIWITQGRMAWQWMQ